MNIQTTLPLAAALLAAAILANLDGGSAPSSTEAPPRIVDLPAITVRPAAGDAAYHQAHKIVELDAVTVHPEPGDMAAYVVARVRAADCLC